MLFDASRVFHSGGDPHKAAGIWRHGLPLMKKVPLPLARPPSRALVEIPKYHKLLSPNLILEVKSIIDHMYPLGVLSLPSEHPLYHAFLLI